MYHTKYGFAIKKPSKSLFHLHNDAHIVNRVSASVIIINIILTIYLVLVASQSVVIVSILFACYYNCHKRW